MPGCASPDGCGVRDRLSDGPGLVRQLPRPGDPGPLYCCYMCFVMPFKFPQPSRAQAAYDPPRRNEEGNPERDGLFDIVDGKSHNPTFERRNRVGPHR